MTQAAKPRFVCARCGGTVIAATHLADIEAVEARHAASCPGAELRRDDSIDPARRRWGEDRVAAYQARIEAARIEARMPRRRRPANHPSQQELA